MVSSRRIEGGDDRIYTVSFRKNRFCSLLKCASFIFILNIYVLDSILSVDFTRQCLSANRLSAPPSILLGSDYPFLVESFHLNCSKKSATTLAQTSLLFKKNHSAAAMVCRTYLTTNAKAAKPPITRTFPKTP